MIAFTFGRSLILTPKLQHRRMAKTYAKAFAIEKKIYKYEI